MSEDVPARRDENGDVTEAIPALSPEHRSPADSRALSSRESSEPDRGGLQPGEILGGRFVIVRFLASGGMGQVYEVADTHLQGKHLALKTLRPEIANDRVVQLRFEREVLLAREIRHTNVCPTYDLFRIEGPHGPVTCLTMKLLRGESLAARLLRSGPMTPEIALPIVRQMAGALDAAHAAGVIHRDFKPGNVMLEQAGQDVRVAVTDFGLSRAYEADLTLADAGQVCGTLGYLAPELLEGSVASPASDIYAFGVVVYEMLTGRKPTGRSGSGLKRVAPSGVVRTLPGVWDRAVMGCLQPDPARRFQSAGEAIAVLEGSGTRSLASFDRRISRRRWMEVGAGACTVGVVTWLGWPRIDELLHPLPQKRFVALMAWPPSAESTGGALIKGILDQIGERLARAEAYVKNLLVISAKDISAQAAPARPSDTVGALGATLVLTASLNSRSGGYQLLLKLLDAATAAVLRQGRLFCASSELSQFGERGAVLAAKLLDVPSQDLRAREQDELANVSPAAYQAFAEAEDLITQPNDTGVDAAVEKYLKALDVDPHFALAYARLAMAYTRKYQIFRERAALNLAERNADAAMQRNANSAKAVLAQALVYLYSGRTQQAQDALEKALKLDPGSPEILLYKARAYRELDRWKDEETVYREILKDRPNYWPAYNELGWILYRQGRYQEAAEAFGEASTVAPRVALPLTNAGTMYMLLNRRNAAIEAFHRSLQRAPSELPNLNLGDLAFADHDYRKALSYYEKARDLAPSDDLAWRNIADCYTMLGDPRAVTENYGRAAEILSDHLATNSRGGAGWMTLAFYQAKLGERSEAEKDIQTAEERGATDLESQFMKAQALAVLGNKEEALKTVLSCLDQGLAPMEVELALDLNAVRTDPRYRKHAQRHGKSALRTNS